MSRNVQFISGEYYHCYNRGCNKDRIFRSEENYRHLLEVVEKVLPRTSIAMIAYCLMPNHYHFLLRQDGEYAISDLIQAIFNKYTKAFNIYHQRSGTLFEGPFKAIHVDSESYLVHLCRYIHRNPLDAGLVKSLENWKFSNYLEWIEKRKNSLVDKQFVRDHFQSADEYIRFVMEYEPPEKIRKGTAKYMLD